MLNNGKEEHKWETTIRDLYNDLTLLEKERSLLRSIDLKILDENIINKNKLDIGDIFIEVIGEFNDVHRLSEPLLCYVNLGERLEILDQFNKEKYPKYLRPWSELNDFKFKKDEILQRAIVKSKGEWQGLFNQFKGINTLVFCPMFSKSNDLLCVFIATDNRPVEGSELAKNDFLNSLTGLVNQLSIANNHKIKTYFDQERIKLWNFFLTSELSPTKCFQYLANQVPSFLPEFGPIKSGNNLHVQILVLKKGINGTGKDYLLIRASTGGEPDTTKINIADSICGLLISDPEHLISEMKSLSGRPFFYDNPRWAKYKGRYKSYLGKNIKSEFATLLFDSNKKIIGILNIESEQTKSFNVHHQNYLHELADLIAPMVKVFEERLENSREIIHLGESANAKYLESLASTFRHTINPSFVAIRNHIDFLKKISENIAEHESKNSYLKIKDDLETVVGQLSLALNEANSIKKDFSENLSGFGQLGSYDIYELVCETVKLVENTKIRKYENIRPIDIEKEEVSNVFCSPLIKQHLLCVLDNSILSIYEKQLEKEIEGLIKINIYLDKETDKKREIKLNESVVVQIRDNGTGVSKINLAKLKDFRVGNTFRKDKGHGYGLPSVQRYISSIGGRIKLDSSKGEFFEVKLYFDIYREEVHGPLSINLGEIEENKLWKEEKES